MARPVPPPFFLLHGLAATCSDVISAGNNSQLVIGTAQGRCSIYDLDTFMRIEEVYVDAENRSIISVGQSDGGLWVHIRAHAIVFLAKSEDVWSIKRSIPVSHYGYCMVTVTEDYIAYPDVVEKDKHVLRIRDIESDETRTFPMAENAISMCLVADDVTNTFYVADERGTVTKIDQYASIVGEVSLGSSPIFSLAVNKGRLACGSDLPPIRILNSDDVTATKLTIIYPAESGHCCSLRFSPTGNSLIAGFSDGSLRGFSSKTGKCLFMFPFHTQSISSLQYLIKGEEHLLIASSTDEQLSFWKLK